MLNCPYNNICIKPVCDLSCSDFSEFEHWFNRCNLSIANPAIRANLKQVELAESVLKSAYLDNTENSNYSHIGIYKGDKPQFVADLITYLVICKHCRKQGFYNGVYKLNYSQYLEEIKKGWNSRNSSDLVEDMKIWIRSSKYLIICNLGLVRFGDFESQTLLSIFQERYAEDKFTILVLEDGKYSLPGKSDSLFYSKLKKEITSRGVKI